ncbi:ethanolaminephosphotransferase 1-like [Achroia grisella]|uniref:ethanolaminephosphotransferase 1-like n=1 Tax=Achroia grisella TaxID=688607 RepID=UPI0027D2ED7F|nr:ethanolaminephosphotransferase 1-like [Achroia grisella]
MVFTGYRVESTLGSNTAKTYLLQCHRHESTQQLCDASVLEFFCQDGIDGKQARRIGVSGPLGEMFDHGLDSYIVFLIPYCLVSLFGRDHIFSLPTIRGFLLCVSITLNFYTSHCEKYSTGTLYLPWGYDLSMWVATIIFLVPYWLGAGVYKFYVYGDITFVQVLEVLIHATGLFTTLPVAVYNVYLYVFLESRT